MPSLSWGRRVAAALRALVRRDRVEAELDAELRFHLDREIEERVRRGASPAAARREALLLFGGVERVKEDCRDERGVRPIEELGQDLRVALRGMRRTPGFAAAVILTLALGIGATTAITSVVYGVLLRPLPYTDPDRLVVIWETDRNSGTTREGASVPDYFDFRERQRVFTAIAGANIGQVNLSRIGDEALQAPAAYVAHELFPVFGIRPLIGRVFGADEDQPGGPYVALIGERLWRSRFGGDSSVLGRTVSVDDRTYTIIGVLAREVSLPLVTPDIWMPMQFGPTAAPRSRHFVGMMARLRPGVTVDDAQRSMAAIAADLEREYPGDNHARGVNVEPLDDVLLGAVRPALGILLGAAALLLLIACANAANLLFARAAARRREVAMRMILGAGTGRLARQFLAESLLFAFLAAALGAALAAGGLDFLLALAPHDLPRREEIGVSPVVLGMTLLLSIGVALGVGLVPLLGARSEDLRGSVAEGPSRSGTAAPSQTRFRRALVIGELALSVMLVIGAGLLVRSFEHLRQVDPGFRVSGLVRASYRLPASRYPQNFARYPQWTEVQTFHRELARRVGELAGVEAAAIATNHPLQSGFTNSFVILGREAEAAHQAEIHTRIVDASYASTVGLPLRSGRLLEPRDDANSAPAVVINEAARRAYFPDVNPIGQQIRFWGTPREIVGVVGDERFMGPGSETPPAVYAPLAQNPLGLATLIVRSALPEAEVETLIRREVRALDPDLALYDVGTMEQALRALMARERFTTTLLGAFAGVALVLALVGVHGVLSYAVVQRRREMGIRMALGAQRSSIERLVVGQGLTLGAVGVALGILGALAGARTLGSLLHGVGAADPLTYAAVALAVILTAAAASWLPARRATGVDPAVVLREE